MSCGEPARPDGPAGPDAPTGAVCPVCGVPVAGTEAGSCGCGWVLRTGWMPGLGDRQAFDRRLELARSRYDLGTAARAGRSALPFVRGDPDERQWERASERERAGEGAGSGGTRRGGPPAEDVLERALREMDGLMVMVEAGPDNLSTLSVHPGDLDTAEPLRFREIRPWRDIAPMLSDDPAELRFQLAGGLHRVDRAALDATMGSRLAGLLDRARPGTPLAFVCTAPGWTVPERAIALLRRFHPGALATWSTAAAAEALRVAIARQPLRVPYALIVAEPGPDGLRPVTVPLFPRGSRAGREARVRVRRGPGGADHDVALAVVADPAPTPAPTPVSVVAARLPRGTAPVRAVLDGPGQIRWIEPTVTRAETRALDELYARTRAISVEPGYAEVLCAVELGGPPVQAGIRRALVADILELIAADLPDRVRVAVYGYYEHSFTLGEERKRVTSGTWLTDPDAARTAFAALPAAGSTWQADAAPLEDALDEICRRLGQEERGSPRTLLVVGGRPPHPLRQGQDADRELAQPCPRRHQWQQSHAGLRRAGVRFVAVLDRATAAGGDHWKALGADHLAVLEDVRPRELAEALRLVPAGHSTLPFPLRGDQG